MRLVLFSLVGLSVAVTATLTARTPSPAATTRLLDETRATYLEDEGTGRQLAALHLRLEAGQGATRLRIGVSARGDDVEPVPSFRGVHGANHITARELTGLYRRGQLKVVVLPVGGAGKRFGVVRPGVRGRVPERHLRADGTLDLQGKSPERYLLSLEAVSPPLGPGGHEVYLEAKGIPRLRADVRVGPATGTILGVHSLGGHDPEVER